MQKRKRGIYICRHLGTAAEILPHFEFGFDEIGCVQAGLSSCEVRLFRQGTEIFGDGFVAGETEESVRETTPEGPADGLRET